MYKDGARAWPRGRPAAVRLDETRTAIGDRRTHRAAQPGPRDCAGRRRRDRRQPTLARRDASVLAKIESLRRLYADFRVIVRDTLTRVATPDVIELE